jgi:hypothetical protein
VRTYLIRKFAVVKAVRKVERQSVHRTPGKKSFIHKRINGMTPVPTQKQLREDSDDDMFMQLNEDNNVGAGDRS